MKPETRGTLLILALSIIWKTLLLLTGWVDGPLGKYPFLPITAFMLIGMYRGMEERRKLSYTESIPFKEMFKSGASIAALFAVLYSLFIYYYLFYLDTMFKVRFAGERIEEFKSKGQNPDNFPFEMPWVLFTFIGTLVLGVFYSGAITRMIIKRNAMLEKRSTKPSSKS
jgi:hypothetical protein